MLTATTSGPPTSPHGRWQSPSSWSVVPRSSTRWTRPPATLAALDSADRRAGFYLDLSRAYAQSGVDRDLVALQYIDTADRIAPTRIRNDPIARDLVVTLDRRARRRVWELD